MALDLIGLGAAGTAPSQASPRFGAGCQAASGGHNSRSISSDWWRSTRGTRWHTPASSGQCAIVPCANVRPALRMSHALSCAGIAFTCAIICDGSRQGESLSGVCGFVLRSLTPCLTCASNFYGKRGTVRKEYVAHASTFGLRYPLITYADVPWLQVRLRLPNPVAADGPPEVHVLHHRT